MKTVIVLCAFQLAPFQLDTTFVAVYPRISQNNICLLYINFFYFAVQVIPLCSIQTVHLVGSWPSRQNNSPCHPFLCGDMNIRSAFPSEDGSYTGYIVGDDDESTFDSELEQAWKDFLNG